MKKSITILTAAGLISGALTLHAQSLVNPSFEADTFGTFPGYVNGNAPITGWDSAGGAGINPGTTFSPFADNGRIPNGTKVAFIQEDSAISQMITGLTVGQKYAVRFWENARANNFPYLTVTVGGERVGNHIVDGQIVVAEHEVTSVGGSNPYRQVISDIFTASATEMLLGFTKSNPAGGDNTVLVDNVSIIPVETKAYFLQQPAGRTYIAGENVVLEGLAFGEPPLSYQWLRNDQAINGATDPRLEIASVTGNEAGSYTLRVTNGGGETTSTAAVVAVVDAVPGVIFNTGVDSTGFVLEDNAVDLHYRIVVNPDGPSRTAIVQNSAAFPIVTGPWVANSDFSKWIGPRFDTAGAAGGDYTFRTTFHLTEHDAASAVVTGLWATDNPGLDILINGQSTGNTSGGFTEFSPFVVSSGFVPGINVLDFKLNNAALGYIGLRVENVQLGARTLPAGTGVTIAQAPTAQSGRMTGSATFTVGASGSGPVTYQWLFNGNEIQGATSPTLELSGLTQGEAGNYSVRVTNPQGSVTTTPVALTVLPQADVTTDKYAGIWIHGIVGRRYRIEFHEDVAAPQWQALTEIVLVATPTFYLDRGTPSSEKRFYRAVLLP